LATPKKLVTADGLDLQFGTNVVGHYYLTSLLLPTLISTAKSPSNTSKTVRVINLTSLSHATSPQLDVEAMKDAQLRNKYSPLSLYDHSKLVSH
jgi:retinol dehydrogenase 12